MKFAIIIEVVEFIFTHKKWWIATLLLLLILLGFILVAGESSPLGPFIYTLF